MMRVFETILAYGKLVAKRTDLIAKENAWKEIASEVKVVYKKVLYIACCFYRWKGL